MSYLSWYLQCMEADEISMNICYLNEYVDTDEWIVH